MIITITSRNSIGKKGYALQCLLTTARSFFPSDSYSPIRRCNKYSLLSADLLPRFCIRDTKGELSRNRAVTVRRRRWPGLIRYRGILCCPLPSYFETRKGLYPRSEVVFNWTRRRAEWPRAEACRISANVSSDF